MSKKTKNFFIALSLFSIFSIHSIFSMWEHLTSFLQTKNINSNLAADYGKQLENNAKNSSARLSKLLDDCKKNSCSLDGTVKQCWEFDLSEYGYSNERKSTIRTTLEKLNIPLLALQTQKKDAKITPLAHAVSFLQSNKEQLARGDYQYSQQINKRLIAAIQIGSINTSVLPILTTQNEIIKIIWHSNKGTLENRILAGEKIKPKDFRPLLHTQVSKEIIAKAHFDDKNTFIEQELVIYKCVMKTRYGMIDYIDDGHYGICFGSGLAQENISPIKIGKLVFKK